MPFFRHFETCPAALAPLLDNWVRRLIHNPGKILAGHVKEGQTVLDVGCGPGVFSTVMAEMVGENGMVIAADIQDEMLRMVKAKSEKLGFSGRIKTHRSDPERIGVGEAVDFALAFYMVHEVRDRDGFFRELRSILRPGGRLLVVEPIMHVSRAEYEETLNKARDAGFKPVRDERVFLSRAKLFERP